MNERIRELQHKAQQYANKHGVDEFGGEDRNKNYDIFCEKFAELILQECYQHFTDTGLGLARKTLSRHFE